MNGFGALLDAHHDELIKAFRAGARWHAVRAADCAPDLSTECGRAMADIDRISGMRDVPQGPTDDECRRALGIPPAKEEPK